MSWNRPSIIDNEDTLYVRGADKAEYRIPFTFIQALNEGVLFDRSARVFKEAAQAHQLFEVVNTRTEALIGTCILHDNPVAVGRQCEVGGMMIHPGARHLGLNTLLTKVVMVRELCLRQQPEAGIEYIAHVVDGNSGPVHSLMQSGFRPKERVIVKPGDVDADIAHMIEPGTDGVVMQSYVFDKDRLLDLALDVRNFLRAECMIRTDDLSVHIDLSAMIGLETLDRFLDGR